MERQPIKHLGQPAEIAEIALMLASDGVVLPDRPDHRGGWRPLVILDVDASVGS